MKYLTSIICIVDSRELAAIFSNLSSAEPVRYIECQESRNSDQQSDLPQETAATRLIKQRLAWLNKVGSSEESNEVDAAPVSQVLENLWKAQLRKNNLSGSSTPVLPQLSVHQVRLGYNC